MSVEAIRDWRYTACDMGGRCVSKMTLNKVYIYQTYCEIFVEFDSIEDCLTFKDFADRNLPYWDFDPIHIINTYDSHDVDKWKEYFGEAVFY